MYKSPTKGKSEAWISGYVDAGNSRARKGFADTFNSTAVQNALYAYAAKYGWTNAKEYEKGWKYQGKK